ncbi:uncharacterized protein LOC132200531 isoform X2 [Neocloeon triangulifer]|uniref:uncharacterized protein LOC132200531 isoform X2 n=1 Tax=Neocloeon triangulifer TaxID=2078957 RepID=UPI00286F2051|nr:uncharacterized protein LOC132200531 isoform X2 [Neocloeon triangulifer]
MDFWGVKINPGREKVVNVEHQLHLVSAVLDMQSIEGGEKKYTTIGVETSSSKGRIVICNLRPKTSPEKCLNLVFAKGSEIVFSVEGHHPVHLMGNTVPKPAGLTSSSFGSASYENDQEEAGSHNNSETTEGSAGGCASPMLIGSDDSSDPYDDFGSLEPLKKQLQTNAEKRKPKKVKKEKCKKEKDTEEIEKDGEMSRRMMTSSKKNKCKRDKETLLQGAGAEPKIKEEEKRE